MPAYTTAQAQEITKQNAAKLIKRLAETERGTLALASLAGLASILPRLDRANLCAFAGLFQIAAENEIPGTFTELLRPYSPRVIPDGEDWQLNDVFPVWIGIGCASVHIVPTLDPDNEMPRVDVYRRHNEAESPLATTARPDAAQLETSAQAVVDAWEGGDLAAAVRGLAAVLAVQTDTGSTGTTTADACRALVNAYRNGEASGGSVDWSDLDHAHELAREALNLPPTDPDDDDSEPDHQDDEDEDEQTEALYDYAAAYRWIEASERSRPAIVQALDALVHAKEQARELNPDASPVWSKADLLGFLEYDEDTDDDDDKCRKCGAANDDGEGWDGLCGNCADKAEEPKKPKAKPAARRVRKTSKS